MNRQSPVTSQSPADNEIDVMLANWFCVSPTSDTADETYSPTHPVQAELFVVVPIRLLIVAVEIVAEDIVAAEIVADEIVAELTESGSSVALDAFLMSL